MKTIFTIYLLLFGSLVIHAQDNGNSDYTNGFIAYFKKDYATAITLYKSAINKGNAKAMIAIGDLYRKGEGVAKNQEEANKWYEKGHQRYVILAQAGDVKAAAELADLYYKGDKIEKNFDKALKYYLPKALGGNASDMVRVAHIYEFGGFGTTKDLKKAAEWYLKADEYGQNVSGALQRLGISTPKKLSAEDIYTKMMAEATSKADPSEHRALAMKLYVKQLKEENVPAASINQKAKEKLLKMAAIDFYATFRSMLGLVDIPVNELNTLFTPQQQAVMKDLAKSLTNKTPYPSSAPAKGQPWSARGNTATYASANTPNQQTNPTASNNTPKTTPTNNGATEFNKGQKAYQAKNYQEAFTLYQIAAEKGLPQAMHNLAVMYYKGEGVKKDLKKTFYWYKAAADKDFPNAMASVGVLYYYGWGTEKNAQEAFKWVKNGVDKGKADADVVELLALMYEHGRGTAQNYAEAEKWYQKAAGAGRETAAASLKLVQENKIHTATSKAAFAGSKVPKQLFAFKDDNHKYGFKDEAGNIVIEPKYDNFEGIYFSSDGMAKVRFSGKWGFINQLGKEVITPKYDQVKDFTDGVAGVQMASKWGLIDKTGKMIVPPKYDEIGFIHEGMIAVNAGGKKTQSTISSLNKTEGGWGFIDKTGKEVIPLKYSYVYGFFDGLSAVEIDKKKYYIDKTGKEVIPPKYSITYSFKEGLAKVYYSNLWGFVNTKGEEVIPPTLGNAGDFSEGLVSFQRPYYQQKNHKNGYMDKTGREIVPPKYDKAENFSEGMAAVGNGKTEMLKFIGKWGFVDKTGREIVPLRYDKVGKFSEGLAAVSLSDQWGFIDKRGVVVIPLQYEAKFYMFDYIAPAFKNGVAEVVKDGQIILIDKTGKTITTVGTVPKSVTNP